MNGRIEVIKHPEVSELAGEKVMIDFDTGRYFMLKGVANDIWEKIQEAVTIEKIVVDLLNEYDIDEMTCRESVEGFLHTLEEKKFIQICSD